MLLQRIEDFLHHLRYEKRYSPATLTAYGKDLAQAAEYLSRTYGIAEVQEITHQHLRSWLVDLRGEGLEARSLNRKLSAVSSLFKFLIRTGIVEGNPAKSLHGMRTPQRLPQFLKEEETAMLLGETQFSDGFAGATERLALELLYACGLRRAELVGLREDEVEHSLRQIRVLGKGGKVRLVPVPAALLEDITAYIQLKGEVPGADRTALLVTEKGEPIYGMWVYRLARKYLAQVSTLKKTSPHVLRHTFATQLLTNGANIQAIKELLGHSSLAATQVYTHTSIDHLKDLHRRLHPRG